MPSLVVLRSPCRIVVFLLVAWSLLPSLDRSAAYGQPVHHPTLVDTVTVDPQLDERWDTYVGDTNRHWTAFSDLHLTGHRDMGLVGLAFGMSVGGGYTWRRVGFEVTLDMAWPHVGPSFWEDGEEPDDLGGHMVGGISLRTHLTLYRTSTVTVRALGGGGGAFASAYRKGCGFLGSLILSDEVYDEECPPITTSFGVDPWFASYGLDVRFYDPLKMGSASYLGIRVMRTGADYRRDGESITGGLITVSFILGAWGTGDR